MATPGTAPIQILLEPASNSGAAATHSLLAAMLRATDKVSACRLQVCDRAGGVDDQSCAIGGAQRAMVGEARHADLE